MKPRRNEQGVAVVVLIGALLLLGAYFVLANWNFAAVRVDRDRATTDVLLRAKEALVAYAAADANRPGELPCPDVDNDGQLTLGVDYGGGGACTSLIGRLPFRTLDLPDLRDDSGERLWYALSADFRAGATVALNSDTAFRAGNTSLSITGLQSGANLAAIVFAPGAPLKREGAAALQTRAGAGAANVVNYLDAAAPEDNADGNTSFTVVAKSETFNDRALAVHSDDIMWLVERRAARELAQYLRDHYDKWQNAAAVGGANKGFYPYAAPFNDPSTAQVGSNGTTSGLLPLSSTPLVWTSAPAYCAGVGTPQIDCTTLVVCIIICIPTITAEVGDVATRFADPPDAANVQVVLGLSLGGSATWTLNKPARRLDFSYGGFITAGIVRIRVDAPQTSSWIGSSWLTDNDWHQNAYYAIAEGYAVDGVDSCGGGAPACITVNNTMGPTNDKEAVVVMTGRRLPLTTSPAQTQRPVTAPAPVAQYLEGANTTGAATLVFESNARTTTFNDLPMVVRP